METDYSPGTYVLDQADLGYLVLGIVFVAIGLITLLLTFLRSARRDASFLLFGIMSCIWGMRFLLYTQLVPTLLAGSPHALDRPGRGLTYIGASAAFGFAAVYLGAGWRSSLRVLAYVSLVFALAASAALAVNPDRDLLLPAFNVMILVGAVTVIANTLRPDLRRQVRETGLVAGICVGVAFFVLENLRALGLVPIPFDVEWIGVLIVYFTLGRLIARRLFVNERRLAAIEQELATARQIQASLLPRQIPRTPGVAMAARYEPMNDVAGDIYDFVKLDERRQAILVADVSGHGVPAALIATMVKGAFRAQVDDLERPERVLAGMNRILTGQLDQEFVTAGCAFVDTGAGVLRYAGAGHPPLLVLPRDSDRCVAILQNGLILGRFPEAEYSSVERPLATGDRLLFYTDGILEATNARGEEFGEASLHGFLGRNRRLPAADFADALLAAVGDWTKAGQGQLLEDDLTLIVVDVGGQERDVGIDGAYRGGNTGGR